jgi:hypothetical protein
MLQPILDAAYRRPPFEEGETEKGFRDCMVVECFMQLVADSPRTPNVCRIVLVTGDGLVAKAVELRIAESTNTAVISTLEELKGLINTLVSQVDETFLASIKPKAEKLFFIPKDESTLFYKENIRERLNEKFAKELAAPPAGASMRENEKWLISSPNFVKKTRQRIQWTSRIEIQAKASKLVPRGPKAEPPSPQATLEPNVLQGLSALGPEFYMPAPKGTLLAPGSVLSGAQHYLGEVHNLLYSPMFGETITTHKGVDVYEVIWSVDVTTARELRRPSIDEINHSGPAWEQIT